MKFYGVTDVGKTRKQNQDRIYLPQENDKVLYFVVADGMGGVNGGEIAATTAIEEIKTYIDKKVKSIEFKKEEIEELIKEAILKANKSILKKATRQKELTGMGTTIVMALVYGNRVYIGHVGDSRIYRIRNNIIRQLTKDHSYVQALLNEGTITKQEARNHPQKNILLKVVGCEENVEPDLIVKGFIKGDVLLLCTDGLTNMVSTDEMYNIIVNGKENLENACEELINMANANGGYDNISAILISKD